MAIIAPSILSADFARLGEDCRRICDAGADWLHIDVMDGSFVPNLSFGLPVLRDLHRAVDSVYDVHLMIDRPQEYIPQFVSAGADWITFHLEAESPVSETLALIAHEGAKPGLVIKPGTPVQALAPYLEATAILLVMTVEPGFGGQHFMPDMLPKLAWLKAEREKRNLHYLIEVDGGINAETAPACVSAGADVLVAGSAVFGAKDARQAISVLHKF